VQQFISKERKRCVIPIYEYECDPEKDGCGHTFEEFAKMSDPVCTGGKCPECGKLKLHRLFGVPGLIFKGTGWTEKFHGNSSPPV
jgi:putative FmdB family regulatory protein